MGVKDGRKENKGEGAGVERRGGRREGGKGRKVISRTLLVSQCTDCCESGL